MSILATGIFLGVLLSGAVFLFFSKRTKEKLRIGRISELEIKTQNTLDTSVFKTVADRALLLKLHNGGKIFAGVQKKITVLQESNSDKLKTVKADFQNFKVDANYMKMINTLVNEKMFIEEVKNLPPGMLKRRYDMENIKATVIFYICTTENGLYFGSMSTTRDINDFVGSPEYSIIETKINKLRVLYEKARQRRILH